MLVNPAPDALVRDPTTARVIEARTEVNEAGPYWARLLVDGDIVPAEASAAPAPTKRAAPQIQEEVNN